MSNGVVFIAEFIRSWAAFGFSARSCDVVAMRCGLVCRLAPAVEKEEPRALGGFAGLLGKIWPQRPGKVEVKRSAKFDVPAEQRGNAAPPPAERPRPADPPRSDDAPPPRPPAMRLQPVSAPAGEATRSSGWWQRLEPLAPSPQSAPAATEPPPPEPLLQRPWQRAIIAEVAATFRAEGEPDVAALVDALARQQLPRQLPRQRLKSIRRGLRCYLDIGDGMAPFAADQKQLVGELQKIVGPSLLAVRRFRGTPLRQTAHFADDAPAAGQPVLVISDLGIGRPRYSTDPAPIAEWLAFAQELTRRGHGVIALTPYPPARWPRPLQQAITILFWDPRTNARAVAAALRTKSRMALH